MDGYNERTKEWMDTMSGQRSGWQTKEWMDTVSEPQNIKFDLI